jgi:hypothetical protein
MRGVGPTDWRHTKQARKAKKRPQAWRAWGRRDCRRAGLSSPPAPRLCWHDRPSKRGEHPAGPALKFSNAQTQVWLYFCPKFIAGRLFKSFVLFNNHNLFRSSNALLFFAGMCTRCTSSENSDLRPKNKGLRQIVLSRSAPLRLYFTA